MNVHSAMLVACIAAACGIGGMVTSIMQGIHAGFYVSFALALLGLKGYYDIWRLG